MKINQDNSPFTFNENGVCSLPNSQVVEVLMDRIRRNPEKYLGDPDVEVSHVYGKAMRGQELARTFRFQIAPLNKGHEKIVYIKLCAKWEKLDVAKQEFETLRMLYGKLSSNYSELNVARPIDYYQDMNAYAQESVGDKNFKDYLLKSNSQFRRDEDLNELYQIIGGCAHWLHAFHEMTMFDEPQPFDYNSFMKSEEEGFNFSILEQFPFHGHTLRQINNCLQSLAMLHDVECPAAKWHFDYTPAHIFIDNGISVIDITGLDRISIFEDIGHFCAALSTVNNLPFYPFFDHRRALHKLTQIFIQSYWERTSLDEVYFQLFVNCHTLKYLSQWLDAQYQRVSSKVHPLAAKAYANIRLVRIFEPAILHTTGRIDSLLGKFKKCY